MTDLDTLDVPADDGNDVRWDLGGLVADFGGMDGALDRAAAIAEELQPVRGAVASLDAAGLAAVLGRLSELQELIQRGVEWAQLEQCTDTEDPVRGARVQRADERATEIANRVLFFGLEWAAVAHEAAESLLGDPQLAAYVNHLRVVRAMRDHLLPESEEQLLARKAVTGRSAWVRLFEELVSAISVTLDGAPATLERGLSALASIDPGVRAKAAAAVTDALAAGLKTRAFILNTLMADKATDDELRRFPTWVSSRNLDNQASDASVDALVSAVQARYDLPQRWYRLKARILGVERLHDFDRMASVASSDRAYGFTEGKGIVLDAFRGFSPELADISQRFFDEGWIDAGTRPGKRFGAFCAYTVPSHHPYVLLNWTSRRGDVLTLAHELGHGVHAYLARSQTVFSQGTPLTVAETASVFGEQLTFAALLADTADANDRLALLAESIEGGIATVFRQVAMNRFEHGAHTARRAEGELSVDRLGDIWAETQGAMLGEAVEVTPGYRTWWSYIPHFIGVPGYVYAYSYGQLLAMSVFRQSQIQGSDFTARYLHMLSAGGSLPPEDLAKIVGCDLADPGFWDGGLALIEAQIDAAELAAADAGRL